LGGVSKKAKLSTVGDPAMTTQEREVQERKALEPMEVTDDGIETEEREVQNSKQEEPMAATEVVMETEGRY